MHRPAAALVAVLFAATLVGQDSTGLPNFQRLDEHITRGGQPTDEGFETLAERGIKTVIDLRTVTEHDISHEKRTVEDDGMRFVSIPMKGIGAPTEEQVSEALSVLENSDSWPVFVHCRRGSDRTGTVVACYRISHDHWQNGKALDEAKAYGLSVFERGMRHFIENFKPGQAVVFSYR